MALTVVQVAYPLAPVGPDAVGGAEQVLSTLDRALVAHGHRSVVIAAAGSTCAGELVELPAVPPVLDASAREVARVAVREALAQVLRGGPVDLVHLHGVDAHAYLPPPGVPALLTLHLPADWYPAEALAPRRPHTWVHGVSAAQHRALPPSPSLLPPIANGVDLEVFRPGAPVGAHAVCLGRLCPEKGYHLALAAAQAAGVPLVLAGAVFPYPDHEAWVAREVLPRLGAARRWIGPVGLDDKRRLLASARCLVVPSLAPETSSLVAMEALASGTPVVASDVGALSELIEHGRTGWLVPPGDVDALAAALRRVDALERGACRRAAEARCSVTRTVHAYLRRYQALARRRPSRPVARIEHVDGDGLAALVGAWSGLWARCPGTTPFQHPAWLLPWARHLGGEGRSGGMAAWRGGALQALLPCWTRDEPAGRVTRLLGVGPSDVLDVLVGPGADLLVPSMVEALAGACDRILLDDLPEGSPLLRVPGPTAVPSTPCPVVALEGWRDRLSPSLRHNLAYAGRLLERERRATFETADDPSTLLAHLDALFALHAARWGARGEPGVLARPEVQAFHREAAVASLSAGLARTHALRVDGGVVGVGYVLLDSTRAYYYVGGFDPSFARYGPGHLMLARVLDDALASGRGAVDLLRGREPYKYAWGAVDRPQWRREVPGRRAAASPRPEQACASAWESAGPSGT